MTARKRTGFDFSICVKSNPVRFLTAALVAIATATVTAQTGLVNAQLETRSAAAGVEQAIAAVASERTPAWVGYRVPIARRQRADLREAGRCRLEPATELTVLARLDGGRVGELRASGADCDLDAGGMRVVWLQSVNGDDSVRWLRSLLATDAAPGAVPAAASRGRAGRLPSVGNTAIMAIALHDAAAVIPTLIDLARRDPQSRVRSRAMFWLAQRAGETAAPTLRDAIADDPDVQVKRQAVFAVSQLPSDQAVPMLIELARSNRVPEVRRQAMFWLGQSTDPRALAFFESVLLK